MYQQEIEFFWPLTEQIKLDLDYTECDKPKLWTTLPISNGGTGYVLMSTGSDVTWSKDYDEVFLGVEMDG
jgi:hypothetical protein